MIVVGLDTSTAMGGVAVLNNQQLLGMHILRAEESHSENVLPILQTILGQLGVARSAVGGVAVTTGPGSFTGLRIGMTTAKALAYAWRIPVVGVSKLVVQAWPHWTGSGPVVSAVDARRGFYYSAFYEGVPPAVCDTIVENVPEEGTATVKAAVEQSSAEKATVHNSPAQKPADDNPHPLRDTRGEARRSAEEIGRHVEKFVADGQSVTVVGEGARSLVGRLEDVLAPDVRSRLVVPAFTGSFDAAYTALVGGYFLQRDIVDDVFRLVPHYLRRTEAERRCKPSPS